MAKQRKIPQRKCVITQELKPKKDMIRIVRNKEGEVFIDPSGKQNGRGAYLTVEKTVIEKARQEKALNRILKTDIDDAIYDELLTLTRDENEK